MADTSIARDLGFWKAWACFLAGMPADETENIVPCSEGGSATAILIAVFEKGDERNGEGSIAGEQ
ncbi:hypothetical protein [Burkholderia pseudomallei]|uniref:hypothetical protein n=1 Tax=Burkholderia pseudomallei TaxID=28450 RepID=UPI0018DBC223|nr:hypothetical protein [Burkholderia pseudomallei]MBM5580806.1 hypothetical protein [Burkholderia pseudomallei]MBM5588855.1 hypothetical protein [Burkholderia pseudomallei]